MKIYTKTGDRGETSLLAGVRLTKRDPRIELLGSFDELNCALGVALSHNPGEHAAGRLARTQRQLFAIGAELARPELTLSNLSEQAATWTAELESEIDQHTRSLAPLQNFILPGGTPAGAAIHWARAVCRRTERVFFGQTIANGGWVGVYLNRLGDWLFVLARHVNQLQGQTESIWSGDASI